MAGKLEELHGLIHSAGMAEKLEELHDLTRIARFILTDDPALCQAKRLIIKMAQAYSPNRNIPPRYLRGVVARCRQLADALDDEAVRLAEEQVQGGNKCP